MDGRIADRTRARKLLREIGAPGGRSAQTAVVLPFLSGLLLLVQAYLLADILQRAIVEHAGMDILLPEIAQLAGLLLLRSMITLCGERAASIASEKIKAAFRARLFAGLIGGRKSDQDSRASGALAVSIIDQVEQLDGYYARFRPAMIQAACLPLAFGIAMLEVDVVVAALFLLTAPLIPVFMALAGWGAEAAMREQAQALTRLSGRFADRLRGIVTLKLFGQAGSETDAVRVAGEELRERTSRVLRIAFLSSAVLEFFAALGVAGVALYVGLTYLGFLHLAVGLSLRSGLFCLLMAPEVYQPLRLLAAHYHDKKSAESALQEIERQAGAIAAVPAMEARNSSTVPDLDAAPSLAISGLSLATPAGRIILKNVSILVPSGRHAVLLGESGSGKTSLLQAVARLRDYEGQILIGGNPLERMSEALLRKRVSILNQKPFLFRGSVADNLRLANAQASDGDLIRAAEMACLFRPASDDTMRLDTILGDAGAGLSGGQIQRLSLARIFLRDAGLLLLDEPTAHLDHATEADVLDALCDFARGRTMLIATHSAAVIDRFASAFRIVDASVAGDALPHHHSFRQANAA